MIKLIFCLLVIGAINLSYAEGDHHEDSGHSDHDEHEKEEAGNGFKLGHASLKTFELKFLKASSSQILIPKTAIYKGLNEVNVYRYRDQLFKRIDFKVVSNKKDEQLIESSDLKAGDQVVVNGVGFLRIAEIAATGGLESSHSH